MTADPFRPGDPAEYWQMEGESDGYRAIAAFGATALLAFGLNLAARVFAEQHRISRGER